MGFKDVGTYITIAPTLWSYLYPVILVAVGAAILWGRHGARKSWVAIASGIVVALSVLNNAGDRLVFGPEFIRETRLFREVDYLEWRHVLRARTEAREFVTDNGDVYYRTMLLLDLATGDIWHLSLEDLDLAQRRRILDFAQKAIREPQ